MLTRAGALALCCDQSANGERISDDLRRIYLPLIVAVWVAILPTKPVHGVAADREKILEGAKKEGRLVLYTGMETEESSLFTKEFAKKYPFIKPEIFRSNGEKVQARFMVEHRANTHLADIFQTSIVQVYQLKNAAMLARYISEEADGSNRELPLRCVVRPDREQELILQRLGLTLPQRLRPPAMATM